MLEKDDENPTILVIGDWFIDENWLMAKHNTYSSSHTGDIHFLSRHDKIEKRMTSLCGVPGILEALRSNIDKYSFIGFGVWNKNDDEILQCVLCPNENSRDKLKLMTPFTLRGLKDIDYEKGKRMCPYSEQICTYQPELKNLAPEKEESSTNRIIRVFEGHGGGQPHLLYRLDWELPVSGLNYAELDKSVANKDVAAIVIEDHNKGFITETTIEYLFKALGNDTLKKIKWYIRSKVDDPPWLGLFKKQGINVRLRIIDHKLALYKKGPRLWRYGKVLGRASLELLGELSGGIVFEHGEEKKRKDGLTAERVAVLFDDNTVIAKDGDKCFNLYNPPGPKQPINIGRTTIFFSSLIHQDIKNLNLESFGSQCSCALQCAFEWSENASNAWNNNEPYFYGDYGTALDVSSNKNIEKIEEIDYMDAWNDWNKSSETFGISKNKFQLWRGAGSIKGYICTGGPKRDRINELLSSISQFNEQKRPEQPFNCLLVSSPGWGKSFLAKSIAKHFEMSYMEFSISQMATTQDLIDCFDSICSHQNRTEKKVLIFMDEVNCQIEGNLAMGLLLSPIWDGSFIRNGKYYRLSPAVWIFASTEPIETLTSDGNKGSDFVSRLNGPIIELDSLERPGHRNLGKHLSTVLKKLTKKILSNPNLNVYEDEDYESIMSNDKGMPSYIRTDHVYLCVSLLNKFWGPISKIQKDVLQLFYEILPINGIRSIEFFISKFQNIQRGTACCSNVPIFDNFPELQRHIILPKEWKENKPKDDKNSLIDIETLI